MKQTFKRLTALLLVLVSLTIVITSCTSTPVVEDDTEYALVYSGKNKSVGIDSFSLSMMTITKTQGDNVTTIPVTEDMLSAEDLAALKTVGMHVIEIKYKDYCFTVGVKLTEGTVLPVTKTEWEGVVWNCDVPDGYYDDAEGKMGDDLKQALRVIIQPTKIVSYGDLRTLLPKTDPGSTSGKIRLFYDHREVSSTWDSGATWNREHVWPTSKGWWKSPSSSTRNAGTDIHHIRPAYSSGNSSRGNDSFSETTTKNTYCPPDNVKGDVARILMYMLVCYKETDQSNYSITAVVSAINVSEAMEMLLRWNESDPVDSVEITRNNVAYELQGNRNPFIDCEELADMIWGD